MTQTATLPSIADLRVTKHATKCGRDWQEALWAQWPVEASWPGILDVYEAAAYLRIHPDSIRRACTPDRKNQAALKHRRLGVSIRIRKADLDHFGEVGTRE